MCEKGRKGKRFEGWSGAVGLAGIWTGRYESLKVSVQRDKEALGQLLKMGPDGFVGGGF